MSASSSYNLMNYPKHATYMLFISFLISKSITEANATSGNCRLPMVNGKGYSVCRWFQSSLDKVAFNGCSRANSKENLTCNMVTEKYSSCSVSLELLNIEPHEALTDACGSSKIISYNITLKSIQLDQIQDGFKLFENIDNLGIENVTLIDSTLDLTKLSILLKSFIRITKLSMIDVESNGPLRLGQLPYPSTLQTVSVERGKYTGIQPKAFRLGNGLSNLELRDVDFQGNMEPGSIYIDPCVGCVDNSQRVFDITLNHMGLTNLNFQKNAIIINNTGCVSSCLKRSVRIYLTITQNEMARKVPESHFTLFQTDYNLSKIDFYLKYDEIDCCSIDNRWLFKLENTSKIFNIDINCIEIPMKVNEFSGENQLLKVCDKRNYFPIVIIALVCCLLLIVLLAGFGFICVFCILPKHGQAIVLNSRGKKLDRASSETAANSSDANSTMNSDCLEPDSPDKKELPMRGQVPKDRLNPKAVLRIKSGQLRATKSAQLKLANGFQLNVVKNSLTPLPAKRIQLGKETQKALKKDTNFNLPKFNYKFNLKKSIKHGHDKKKNKKSGFKSHNLPELGKQKRIRSVDTLKTEAVHALHISSAPQSNKLIVKTVREPESKHISAFLTKSVSKASSMLHQSKFVVQKVDRIAKSIVANKDDAMMQTNEGKNKEITATNKKSADDNQEGMSLALRTIND